MFAVYRKFDKLEWHNIKNGLLRFVVYVPCVSVLVSAWGELTIWQNSWRAEWYWKTSPTLEPWALGTAQQECQIYPKNCTSESKIQVNASLVNTSSFAKNSPIVIVLYLSQH